MHRWLVVLLLFPGCAFGLTGPDPDRPRGKVPECDTGKGLVALDGVMAAAAGVIALGLASADESEAALAPLAIGALYVGGAIRGNNRVEACRKAMGEYESYMAARDTIDEPRQPPQLPVPPAVDAPPDPVASVAATTLRPAVTPPPVAPTAVAPTPLPAATPAAKPAPKPTPPPAKHDDDWSDFWQEVE